MIFPESELAHKHLDSLAETGYGIEIGGSKHNTWGIKNVINVDYTDSLNTESKLAEIEMCGETLPVDVVAFADELPFDSDSFEFLINSHVFEHQCNPIKTLLEWRRVIKKDGIIFTIIPLRDALPVDAVLPVTTVKHQIYDYALGKTYETHEVLPGHGKHGHYHVYTLESFISLINTINESGAHPSSELGYPRILNKKKGEQYFQVIDIENPDTKVTNGFACVLKVIK